MWVIAAFVFSVFRDASKPIISLAGKSMGAYSVSQKDLPVQSYMLACPLSVYRGRECQNSLLLERSIWGGDVSAFTAIKQQSVSVTVKQTLIIAVIFAQK